MILLGRGGGSLEDLWAFNEECVARAIAASRMPVVTGIGHEVDTSIADLVADYHAHTPTEAAQVVTLNSTRRPGTWCGSRQRLRRGRAQPVQDARHRLCTVEQHETFRRPLVRVRMSASDWTTAKSSMAFLMGERVCDPSSGGTEIAERRWSRRPRARWSPACATAWRGGAAPGRRGTAAAAPSGNEAAGRSTAASPPPPAPPRPRLARKAGRALEGRSARDADDLQRRSGAARAAVGPPAGVGPEQVLRRGYTITIRKRDGRILRSTAEVRPGDRMITRFADGQVEWTAEDPRQPGPFG